ncbi:katanin p80 WD40 repeat-containing subunit B1 homolog KTN80.4-like [Aristolochia californica]|uniref:katanin p80 WD40 repeat-containing subunit B1 homolog KTN80.4-like n=1 Tax=Aristolochia californica TaxID=171875 RepID=UPI0035DB849F
MAKRGYKLQEFIAHTSNVNCLKIGRKSSRLLLTGGEDHKVNLWAIGRPSSLLTLSGHTSSVESVTFDSSEVLAVSGASAGALKLWDLEEAKILRTITGHRSNCTAVEFHPFGEFFASGSLDTNLKIWDIRRKGCIHTYKGHTDGINTIRFTPDGRWVVSGGEDNVVKLWDLTAGKLLHDFKFHEGRIRCIDFHPHEFLLATGSADRTVKFWDLETFELIGSAGPESTGVRSMIFHPDGRTLFCGLEDSFKVWSWEPVRFHDAIDMGWSTLGDVSIHDGKLLGCSYHRSCVGVWVADISLVRPYGVGVPKNMEPDFNPEGQSLQQQAIEGSRSGSRRLEIPYSSKEVHLSSTPFGVRGNTSTPKKNNLREVHSVNSNLIVNKPTVAPVIVPRSNSLRTEKEFDSRKESATPETALHSFTFLDRSLLRKSSNVKEGTQTGLGANDTGSSNGEVSDVAISHSLHPRLVAKDEASESSEGNPNNIRSVTENLERILSPEPSPRLPSENGSGSIHSSHRSVSMRYVKGVAVQHGRTRSLVERWENRERSTSSEALADMVPETDVSPSTAQVQNGQCETSKRAAATPHSEDMPEILMQDHHNFIDVLQSRLTKLQVVRQFWERNDVKGSINAVKRLPDHAVQADVISVLVDKIDVVTLDLFSCLLPLLTGLLDSKVDRFMGISLETLLKLVKTFGPVIYSTMSATSSVGVDLEAEQRYERCKQCFTQLQKLKQILPSLTRRGGLLAKSAMELNLALLES